MIAEAESMTVVRATVLRALPNELFLVETDAGRELTVHVSGKLRNAFVRLLPGDREVALHLSRVTDVLRWLQLGTIGATWLILYRYPGLEWPTAFALSVILPVLLVVLSRLAIGVLEDRHLKPGHWRELSAEEVDRLRQKGGGRGKKQRG